MTLTDEEIIARHDPSVRERAKIELAIVHELIKRLKAAGFSKLFVDDGDDEKQDCDDDEQTLVTAIFAVDQAHLETVTGMQVFLVMGNDGHDIIADYHIGLEKIMDPLLEWIEEEYCRI
jgi:hypothetical protein